MQPIRSTLSPPLATLLLLLLSVSARPQEQPVGYDDTPILPGTEWHVHDANRPQPPSVTSGQHFSDMAGAPSDAVVLFDGRDLSKWMRVGGDEPGWKVENGYIEVVAGSGSISTRDEFGDFQLHLEFATPSEVVSNSQGRGNSGVMIYGRYEIQVLDSWQNRTYPDGQAAAVYGQFPPRVNSSRPPGSWQTYDIVFEAPRWEGDRLTKKAKVTVLHNGVLVHHGREFIGATSHRQVATYSDPHPARGPIILQNHGNPIRYRNIWIRELAPENAE